MGAHLVSVMLTDWAPLLNDRCFRVLTRMALTALDHDKGLIPRAHYFGGHELLVMTLYRARNGTIEAAERTVKRAIAELIGMKAIERLQRGYPGQNAAYKLTLERD